MTTTTASSSPLMSPTSRSRSSTKLPEDVNSITSFNFLEEDEDDQSSYALVTSLFSRVRNSLSAAPSPPLPGTLSSVPITAPPVNEGGRRPSYTQQSSFSSKASGNDRSSSFKLNISNAAPPLVSLTPAQSEVPTYSTDYGDRSPSRAGMFYSPSVESAGDGGMFGTSIPGFPIQDDARSIRTAGSLTRSGSASKVIRRIRGEGLSKDYWMDDENCKECYDCKSVFTTWRRKHHCRICGQIFCSRCASNVIKGSRFGHEGMVRVCNLCLEKLAKVDSDDEDDRRSIISTATSFPAHQLGHEMGLAHHPQSPFAASQLFGSTDEPFNLYSIAEARKRAASGSDSSAFGSRPITPQYQLREREDGIWESTGENVVPFRRGVGDEEKETAHPYGEDSSPPGHGSESPVEFPPMGTENSGVGPQSTIQFPKGSPERESAAGRQRPRFDTYADFGGPGPIDFMRSRAPSRLDSFAPTSEQLKSEFPGRDRRNSAAYADTLNTTSHIHLKVMLRQMLISEQIPNVTEWESVLIRIALRIATELDFTANNERSSADMDERRYVKIKKIPGGAPHDTEYVNGAVITKNVAHKKMARARSGQNGTGVRVMLVTFPLEFSRVEGQYVHFAQILRQEKEYLGNLAGRIHNLDPHVVLCENSVSRIALEALAAYGISVARAVKPSAIQVVSRMTKGDIFSSIDKLALEPRIGSCSSYRVQTFDHPLIPGRRKSYMRFEGYNNMGCTILLRGGDIATLRRIKKVTRFIAFIVRNLSLETHLWSDMEFDMPLIQPVAIPNATQSYRRHHTTSISVRNLFSFPSSTSTPRGTTPTPDLLIHSMMAETVDTNSEEDLPDEDADQLRLTRRIDASLEPYTKTFISASATLRFPVPWPIKRMKELDVELISAKRAWEDDVIRKEEKPVVKHEQEPNATSSSIVSSPDEDHSTNCHADDISQQIEALPLPMFTPVTVGGEALPQDAEPGYFPSGNTSSFSALSMASTPMPEEPWERLKTTDDIATESHYTLVKSKHEEHRRIWEWYLRKNYDDFVVEKYQSISLLEYTIPAVNVDLGEARPCFAPEMSYVSFYGDDDCTLAQYIHRAVNDMLVNFLDPKAICTGRGCDVPLAQHCKVYVHHGSKIYSLVERWDNSFTHAEEPDPIVTWSYCPHCKASSQFKEIKKEMKRYSFAKFLELHFYPTDVKPLNLVDAHGIPCEHNVYTQHIRYFAAKGMTVRFMMEPVQLHEVVYPPFRIRVRPETQLELKNKDFQNLQERNVLWYGGLVEDLKLLSIEATTGEEEFDSTLVANVNVLLVRADQERQEVSRLINKVYRDSGSRDTLALNAVRAFRQDKIVAWQQDFDRLPKPRMTGGATMDRNNRRSSAFGSVRAMWPGRYPLSGAFDSPHLPSSSVSEAEEGGPLRRRRRTGDSFTSSASDASEPEPDSTTTTTEPNSEKTSPSESRILDRGEQLEGALKDDNEGSNTVKGLPIPELRVDSIPEKDSEKDSGESDSTIGALRGESGPPSPTLPEPLYSEVEMTTKGVTGRPLASSKIPRRLAGAPRSSVPDLVRRYQEPKHYPLVSESEQEYTPIQIVGQRHAKRGHTKHKNLRRKPSNSDIEQSYTANIAPGYLPPRRSRVYPGPSRLGSGYTSDASRPSSRRSSPEKRTVSGKRISSRPGSPPPPNGNGSNLNPNKATQRFARANRASDSKSAFRPNSTFKGKRINGTKVGKLVAGFEPKPLGRQRKLSIMNGHRVRPVNNNNATLQVLPSFADLTKDEEEETLSDAGSEADDEGGPQDEERRSREPEEQSIEELLKRHDEDNSVEPAKEPSPPSAIVASPEEVTDSPEQSQVLQVPARPPGPISLPPSPFLGSMRMESTMSLTPPQSDAEAGTERNSILRALSGFWIQPPQARSSMEGDDPFHDPEHIFRDSSMVVRTDEPTSIIALALNSPQYREMLTKSRTEKRIARDIRLTDGSEAFMPDDHSIAESTTTSWGVVNVDTTEADPSEDLKVPSSKLPWAISFESGGLTISCTVLYPEQFDALRRTYDCERSMIESLARCVKWNASGGKSGSAFLKTRDDRFIAKEMSRSELQTMETFAPAYFDYMSSAVAADRPTLLAKVFGVYKITFRKTTPEAGHKAKSTQMNLIVMENLFYDRRFSKIYDLKGSTRNRHVQSTGRENEVLLDENLVETQYKSPFYLREHSKRILRGALYNDSKFLADINVMDYSLVCGVDSQNNELVIGIVDYIRTYTWDKKLESWVKESAWGAGRGEPTIVTPKQYRQRFIGAMERYFPLVPDRWMKQKDAPEEDCDKNLEDLWPDW
ncbi:hypothetical protein CYLTODRAFT_420748 [Cylindrobasidium torrendii FP15055 ss-10]|uniref:1-phosphatidylinositol-3-phosphate 5-kinase n=1 Tax=Cylindrobasidium torrendii FP15055 ss-10 TaxID=1314674 RepID=A0A0D7BGP1_9AGAR|nr:hypothetical protein CYLTODRAFT_420748 [Cylindrobasidium torrendii FP15055 ss-10]